MSFPSYLRSLPGRSRYFLPALALLLPLACRAEKPPSPAVRLPLESLGYPGYSAVLTRAGNYSMATLHLLDSTHLLFTYSLRNLVKRVPGDDENHSDRMVAAEIIEIPSGKVLERTQWRLHDHGRYLWRAGQDVFVLRTNDELSTFAPLHGLARGTAFERVLLPHRPGMPQFISSSADGKILTLETERPEEAAALGDEEHPRHHTTIEFYRISSPAGPGEPLRLQAAGAVGAHEFLQLALDGDGYLWAEGAARNMYQVTFHEYGGKPHDLATVHSLCTPRLALLSRAEFLVEGCNGASEAPMLSAFGFDGHENWEEPLGEEVKPPAILTAPAAGRFAMGRLIATASGSGINGLGADEPLTEEIRVYQTASGDQLLRLQCAIPVRSLENFDLAPDGSELAVLGQEAIEIYALPKLTDRDRKDLADVDLMAPPAAQGPVDLRGIVRPVATGSGSGAETGSETGAESGAESGAGPSAPAAAVANGRRRLPLGTATAAANVEGGGQTGPAATGTEPAAEAGPAAEDVSAAGDAQGNGEGAEGRRKPPTLLEPGEKAEFQGAATSSPQ